MNKDFLTACLSQSRVKRGAPYPVPFNKICDVFDLDNFDRYRADTNYDDIVTSAFGMGVFYGLKKQTHAYLSNPEYKANGATETSGISDSAGVIAMKYLSFSQRKGFALLIKPQVYARPDIISHPMAFGLHGFHDGNDTLYVDKLMLPAFDPYRRHTGFRTTPITEDTLNYAEQYARLCMAQITARSPVLMLENLRAAAPETLVQSLIGEHVGPVDLSIALP